MLASEKESTLFKDHSQPIRRKGAVPAEVYGFVGSIASIVAYALFILWAYIPEQYLHAAGVTYYPSKYWAIALPAYAIVTVFLAVLVYTALCMMSTKPLDSPYTIKDEYSRSRLPPQNSDDCTEEPIPPVSDMDITEVNMWLYKGQALE
ncbi:phosphatidylinositol glycan class P [Klebsormidium nitens]|uniref:Phosphatidylinositol N-acetylglucosaminyltransferase subunit P n=1 Tax=Klebsormidium nitens TaxID=105231 RepID=A0A1Y1I0L7_KLENI|nr:phosphatidylinositol glycan class P [Klebsormidium nitens]|eukprot:GAQ82327.1 phosphatidylinositol glycan class P [Klebsormidium nitens]